MNPQRITTGICSPPSAVRSFILQHISFHRFGFVAHNLTLLLHSHSSRRSCFWQQRAAVVSVKSLKTPRQSWGRASEHLEARVRIFSRVTGDQNRAKSRDLDLPGVQEQDSKMNANFALDLLDVKIGICLDHVRNLNQQ